MKTRRMIIIANLLIITALYTTNAQGTWNWPEKPEDRAKAEECNALYTDEMKAGNFKQAITCLETLIKIAPDLNPSLYINGAKIYREASELEKDEAKKQELQEKALQMYDLRFEHFKEKEAYLMDMKAFYGYRFFKDNKEKYKELYESFKKSFQLNGDNVLDANTIYYMDVIRRYRASGGEISDEEVLDTFNNIMEILDKKISEDAAEKKDTSKLEEVKDNVVKVLTAIIPVECDFITENFGPKLEENPDDVKLAKSVMALCLAGKCLDKPIFMKASKLVLEKEPTFGLAELMGKLAKNDESYDEAEKYFNKALELTEENVKKGEIYISLAEMERKRGRFSSARSYAYKVVEADPSQASVAYTLVGNMYLASFDSCKGGVSRVKDKGVYLAAYEMFRKAGNSSGMGRAKAGFPTTEELFNENISVGATITVGCWINETVTVQKAD